MPGKAGDLLIWDSFMPHGHTFNTTSAPPKVRLNQFMTMYPCDNEAEHLLRSIRIALGHISLRGRHRNTDLFLKQVCVTVFAS